MTWTKPAQPVAGNETRLMSPEEQTMPDQKIPQPPETLGGWWCPACGTFKEQYRKPSRHWSWGELCRDEMQRIIYRREETK